MLTLIVADDDPAMRNWLRHVLSRGLEVRIQEASTGWELLSLLADEEGVDLVISDVRMPTPNGLQVLASARTAGVATPFLLITAFGDEQLRLRAEGMRALVLDKPFSAADLHDHVQRLIVPPGSP